MSAVQLDWWDATIHGVPVYVDQEGVAWARSHGACPRCETPTDYGRRCAASGYFTCTACGVVYDEPVWLDAEAAFVTDVSDDDAGADPDMGIRALHAEYHGRPGPEGWTWPERPTRKEGEA